MQCPDSVMGEPGDRGGGGGITLLATRAPAQFSESRGAGHISRHDPLQTLLG